jgi:alpha-1,2-mannosyltransferase
MCGIFCADLVLVNSSWTYDHIRSLWRFQGWPKFSRRRKGGPRDQDAGESSSISRCNSRRKIHIVYPPCNVDSVTAGNTSTSNSESSLPPVEDRLPYIVSIGQFRPEKDHALQLKAMARLLQKYPGIVATSQAGIDSNGEQNAITPFPRLVLIGSCRQDTQDEALLSQLQHTAKYELGIADHVQFVINQPFNPVLLSYLRKSQVGIHTVSLWLCMSTP